MSLCLATVLALVFSPGQTADTVEGSLSTPSISAEPGLRIPLGHNVTFVCSCPSGYDKFRLEKGRHTVVDKKNTPHSMTEARFLLGPVNESFAGFYTCVYEKGSIWSPRSDTLELMVTREVVTQAPDPGPAVTSGFYRKPTISVLPDSTETVGGKMAIQRDYSLGYDRFILTEEEEHKLSRTTDTQHAPKGRFQALFPVGPVTFSQKRTCRCYDNYKINPYVWSESSDPLKFLVSCSGSQDHRVENVIRITMASLVLMTLAVLLFQACHSQRRK